MEEELGPTDPSEEDPVVVEALSFSYAAADDDDLDDRMVEVDQVDVTQLVPVGRLVAAAAN